MLWCWRIFGDLHWYGCYRFLTLPERWQSADTEHVAVPELKWQKRALSIRGKRIAFKAGDGVLDHLVERLAGEKAARN